MNFFHHHHAHVAAATPSSPIIWSPRYKLPLDSLLLISLAYQTQHTDPSEILQIITPLFVRTPDWNDVTSSTISYAWIFMNEDKHWSIWRAQRRVRAYVDVHGDEGLKEAGRRQMQHLVPGKEEWDIFTGVSEPRTEEEREMEEKGEWEIEQERAKEGKVGGPTEARNGGTTAGYNTGATVPQTGAVVPATIPATPEAKKEGGAGGGIVGKMAKLAFTGMMNHHKKKKQQEKLEQYREGAAEREEEREEEVEKEDDEEKDGEEEEESSSSSSSSEDDDDNNDGNDGDE